MNGESGNLLSMKNITVSYSDVKALKGVDFEVQKGEIHALVGEHRAGKSTLVKLLSGIVKKESGTIRFHGQQLDQLTPETSMKLGISIVYQDSQVIPSLNSVEYLFAGRMRKKWCGCLNLAEMEERTVKHLSELGIYIDIFSPLSSLSVDRRNMIELARAILQKPTLLILDEISNKLTPNEMEIVYRIIEEVKDSQGSVIYITHNMDEIFRFADRVTILKDGYRKGTERIKDLDKIKLIKLTYSFVLSREELQKTNIRLFYFKQYNETIINNLPIGVVILDAENNTYLMNFAAVKNLEIDSDYMANESFEKVFLFDTVDVRNELMRVIKNREKRVWEEVRYMKDKYLTISSYPFYDVDYIFLGTIIMIDDITKDRQFNEYLLRTEKISSIDNLAAGVAHEINNPLGIIQNYLEIVKGKSLDENVRDKILMIESELSRIVEITGNLLSFSKQNMVPEEKVEIAALLRDILQLLNHKLEVKRVRVRWDDVDESIYIIGDENRLKQLFMNLIVNSIEAVGNDGTIKIEIIHDRTKKVVDTSIIDDGCGIPKDLQAVIFEPFYSTKLNKNNTGIGLAICQHIANMYNGLITCKSNPGETTAFTVRFPAYSFEEASPAIGR